MSSVSLRVWLVGLVVVLLAACSPDAQPTQSAIPANDPDTTTLAPPPPPPVQHGLGVYWSNVPHETDATTVGKIAIVLIFAARVGANSLSVSFPFYTAGINSNTVSSGPDTPSAARLKLFVTAAKARGFRVTLRPLMDEKVFLTKIGNWRGTIDPIDRSAWFASMAAFNEPYLRMAQETGVETFVVGSELSSLHGDPGWQGLMAQARTLYSGELSYSVNWDHFMNGDLDVPNAIPYVDAYFPIKLADDAPIEAIVNAWNAILGQYTPDILRRMVFSEVGIPAMDAAYHLPYDWGTSFTRPLNFAVQANWFTAACQAMKQNGLSGIYFWKVDFNTDPATLNPISSPPAEFANRPGEDAIRACFKAYT